MKNHSVETLLLNRYYYYYYYYYYYFSMPRRKKIIVYFLLTPFTTNKRVEFNSNTKVTIKNKTFILRNKKKNAILNSLFKSRHKLNKYSIQSAFKSCVPWKLWIQLTSRTHSLIRGPICSFSCSSLFFFADNYPRRDPLFSLGQTNTSRVFRFTG